MKLGFEFQLPNLTKRNYATIWLVSTWAKLLAERDRLQASHRALRWSTLMPIFKTSVLGNEDGDEETAGWKY